MNHKCMKGRHRSMEACILTERACYVLRIRVFVYTHHSQQDPVPCTTRRYTNCGCDRSIINGSNSCHNHQPRSRDAADAAASREWHDEMRKAAHFALECIDAVVEKVIEQVLPSN